MEKLLLLIKALLKLFSSKKERVTIPKRLTEEGREIEPPLPTEDTELVLKDPPRSIAKKQVKYIWCDGEKYPIEWDKIVTYK